MFSTLAPIRARVSPSSWLRIRTDRWCRMLDDLAERGRGDREAGAFLLAERRAPNTVASWIAYDDLDPGCLTGGISFAGEAIGRLSQHCATTGYLVLGDVHTHPGPCVAQSSIDRANPMLSKKGA